MVNNIALYIIVKCELSQLTVFGNFLNVPPFYPSLRERIVYWKCDLIKIIHIDLILNIQLKV